MSKYVIYQLLPRYFSNQTPDPVAHGSRERNGCGTLDGLDEKALDAIKAMGVTHVWLTGVLEHATKTDYRHLGIPLDHPAVVKGQAGSPYAIKDYYDVSPDLAVDPTQRLNTFRALVGRCHALGLKVLIDFVPNHVARQYHSDQCMSGMRDLGADDLPEHAFNPSNNFYYLPGQALELQVDPYGGWENAYTENPAKATGNDCFSNKPGPHDWYETVKLNYGVNYYIQGQTHFDPTPSTWFKMLDILNYWAGMGVDGFRCDMAEMVPVEFWHWAIARMKQKFPNLLFIAEVYNPHRYRDFIFKGGFDYLYDKVGFYDTLRAIIEGKRPASDLSGSWQTVNDILPHMLYFLENHDEQRIASSFFAGDAAKGYPGMVVCAALQTNPVMVYAGQEWGEAGMDEEGFSGLDGRSTIFDYWSLKTLAGWNNGGQWDGGGLSPERLKWKASYDKLFKTVVREKALAEGRFFDLTYANLENPAFNSQTQFAWFRKADREIVLAIVHFGNEEVPTTVFLPAHAFAYLELCTDCMVEATDLLTGQQAVFKLTADSGIALTLPPHSGQLWKFIV